MLDKNWIKIQIKETELKHVFIRMDNLCIDRNLCSITEITAGGEWINYLFSMHISIYFFICIIEPSMEKLLLGSFF